MFQSVILPDAPTKQCNISFHMSSISSSTLPETIASFFILREEK
jgi:hypothetical protein